MSGRRALAPRRRMPYMDEPWFARLAQEIERTSMGAAAARIGVTASAVSQVFNGAGAYGDGTAGTRKFGARVELMLDVRIACPFLGATTGEERLISGAQCAEYAYREVPTGSPLATRHWRACRGCALRVPAPKGWDEPLGTWTIPIKPARPAPAAAAGVAAPVHSPEEAQ